ncbi:ParB/RepB/Spo0J family partition protein, partial [Lacticaseibacillus paracasei]|uniref:ParB/RepB/Spo0J family partition protein n=1 Tax=Lacticaseibacillus paracasei TaxID=1597 RepID=UPI00194EC28E
IEGAKGWEVVPARLITGGKASDAMAKSLAANITQLPLHPVDQFEAFANVRDSLLSTKSWEDAEIAIADRYGVSKDVVRRRLALGDLAPEIRAAWREGKIEGEVAKVFTLLRDQKAQADLFAKLKRSGHT